MRNRSPRGRHTFRPLTDVLESLAPVSSLVPGLAEVGGAVASASPRDDASSIPSGKTPARPLALAHLAATAPLSQTRATQHVSRGQGSHSLLSTTNSVSPTVAERPASPATPEANMVTFAAASAPSTTSVPVVAAPRPSFSAAPSPSGGITLHATPQTPTPSNPSPSPSAATYPVINAPSSVIRPLSLAPSTTANGSGLNSAYATPAYASGGGPPPDMPPNLFYSGGSGIAQLTDGNGNPIPGQYTVTSAVPIGTVAYVSAGDPGADYHIINNDWGGGSVYAGYISASATSIITGGQSLVKNPDIYGSAYSFIVDSNVRTYTIIDQVTYSNGAHGSSTLTFTSVAPNGALTTPQLGTQTAVDTPDGRGVALEPGIEFQATASTDSNTSGAFMFMQILNTTYDQFTDKNGKSTYTKNNIDYTSTGGQNFSGPLQDDGNPLGYPFDWIGDTTGGGGNSWYLTATSAVPDAKSDIGTPQTDDSPLTDDPNSPMQVSSSGTFSMYLMYRPIDGVWIALSEVDWSWSETAMLKAGVWTGPTSLQPKPNTKTPTGDSAFPTWVNTTANYEIANLNPYRDGDPGP